MRRKYNLSLTNALYCKLEGAMQLILDLGVIL